MMTTRCRTLLAFLAGSQNRLSRDEQARQHNTAIEGLQAMAAKFNEQVRLFKSRSG